MCRKIMNLAFIVILLSNYFDFIRFIASHYHDLIIIIDNCSVLSICHNNCVIHFGSTDC